MSFVRVCACVCRIVNECVGVCLHKWIYVIFSNNAIFDFIVQCPMYQKQLDKKIIILYNFIFLLNAYSKQLVFQHSQPL